MPDDGISRSRILIVDDEREITGILSDLLCAEHDCETAGSAEAALARLPEQEFRLVIKIGRASCRERV